VSSIYRHIQHTLIILGQEGCGSGRIFTYDEPVSLSSVVERVKALTGLKHGEAFSSRMIKFDCNLSNIVEIIVRVATASPHTSSNSAAIKTVAICAGSGSSVLAPVKADLYFSGEMGHHDVLAALAQDTSVILCKFINLEPPLSNTMLTQLFRRAFQYRERLFGCGIEACASQGIKQ
jgi:putative NIF3 family GTP cyclohydrolase 1 type 2